MSQPLVRSCCAENDEPLVELGVRCLWVVCFGYCRVRGMVAPRSWNARRWVGKRGYGVVGAGEVDLVAGEGAQVGEQSLVAVGGQVGVGGGFSGGFGVGRGGSVCWCDGVVAFGWVFVGEGQRGQRF